MGTYLSHPVKEKYSESSENEMLSFGATSMQGWRLHQEDAHNCILHLDHNCSMFAVYDGHGGPEVSGYAAKNLSDFIKSSPSWIRGDIGRGLIEAFLNFDQKLITPEVVPELQMIRNQLKSNHIDRDDENSDRNDEQASMPFEKIMERLGFRFHFNADSAFGEDDVFITRKALDVDEKCLKSDDNLDAVTLPLTPPSSPAVAQYSSSPPDVVVEDTGVVLEAQVSSKFVVQRKESTPIMPLMSSCVIMDEDDAPSDHDAQERSNKMQTTTSVVKQSKDDANFMNLADSKDRVCPTMEMCSDDSQDGEDAKKCTMEVENCVDRNECKTNDVEVEMETFDQEVESEPDFVVLPNNGDIPGVDSGTTACVAVIKDNMLFVANAGDSRCVLSRNGTAVDMSVDHKPEDELERERIEKAGGTVTNDGRVNGGLNLSRAFGDHSYKKSAGLGPEEQMISAFPDVRVEPLTPDDKFLIVACDGIWNSMTSQELVDFVSLRLGKGSSAVQVCEEVCDACLSPSTMGDGTGCDNMTIIIVIFKQLTFS